MIIKLRKSINFNTKNTPIIVKNEFTTHARLMHEMIKRVMPSVIAHEIINGR